MPEREYFMLISIVSDKNDILKHELIDWTVGRYKQIYWGMFPCEELLAKKQDIIQSASEHGYKILNTRKIKAGKIP